MEDKKLVIDLAQLLEDKGIKFRENSSNELIMDQCYNCGRSKKLYVHKESGLFVCFRCDEKGNGVKLVAKYLQISFKEASKLLYGSEGKIYASPSAVQEEEDEPLVLNLGGLNKLKKTGDLQLPPPLDIAPEFTQLKPEHTVPYNYLIKRGYTATDIEELKLLILPFETFGEAWKAVETRLKATGLSGEKLKEAVKLVVRCHERIMFPVYVDYNILGYVARDYTGTKQPKVLNSSGNFRSFSVWNFDNARASEELVICEGTTSAVKCGIDRSIALLGKAATSGQIRLIRKSKAKKIYICLDVGTDKEVGTIYQSLSIFYPGKIHVVKLPPVIDLKITISSALVKLVNDKFGTNLKFLDDTNQIYIPAVDKQSILKELNISNKLPSDEKRSLFYKRLSSSNDFPSEIISQLAWIIFDGEYKDSGDYTHQEMDEFITQAQVVQGGLQLN